MDSRVICQVAVVLVCLVSGTMNPCVPYTCMEHIRVIVAGYDHYEGVDLNPSYQVPQALAHQGMEGLELTDSQLDDPLEGVDVDITAVTMPVSFARAWPILHQAIEETTPDIVIATGLKRVARGISMERCAVNIKEVSVDCLCEGAHPGRQREPVDPDGPAAYWTRLPLRAILQEFGRSGIPATLSSDAGTYVCNALFYRLLEWASKHQDVLAGFVSLPMINETEPQGCGLPLDQQIRAVQKVVSETVRYYRQPSSSPILIA